MGWEEAKVESHCICWIAFQLAQQLCEKIHGSGYFYQHVFPTFTFAAPEIDSEVVEQKNGKKGKIGF